MAGARATATGVLPTHPSGTWQAVPLNATITDDANLHSTTVNNSRLTLTAGTWDLAAGLAWGTAGLCGVAILLNGATYLAVDALVSNPYRGAVSTVRTMVAGDYVECFGLQTSGGAVAPQVLAEYSPVLAAVLLR